MMLQTADRQTQPFIVKDLEIRLMLQNAFICDTRERVQAAILD